MKIVVVVLAALLLAGPVQAGLDWERRDANVTAEPGQEEVRASFAFTNSGKEPVTITKVTSSCGCTTAKLEQKTYRPGESGEIAAVFTVGNNTGRQTKRIAVRTTDEAGTTSATTLAFRVRIPELVRLSSPYVYWRADEPLAAKMLELEVVHEEPVTIAKVNLDGPAVVEPKLETLEAGKRYRLHLTPTGEAAGRARLHIEAKLAEGRSKRLTATARVLPRPGIEQDTEVERPKQAAAQE